MSFFRRLFCFYIILINGFCLLLSIKDAILHGSYIDFIVLGKNICCDVNKINWEPNNLIHIYINIVQTTSSTIDTLSKCIYVHNEKGHYNAIYVTSLVYLYQSFQNQFIFIIKTSLLQSPPIYCVILSVDLINSVRGCRISTTPLLWRHILLFLSSPARWCCSYPCGDCIRCGGASVRSWPPGWRGWAHPSFVCLRITTSVTTATTPTDAN